MENSNKTYDELTKRHRKLQASYDKLHAAMEKLVASHIEERRKSMRLDMVVEWATSLYAATAANLDRLSPAGTDFAVAAELGKVVTGLLKLAKGESDA